MVLPEREDPECAANRRRDEPRCRYAAREGTALPCRMSPTNSLLPQGDIPMSGQGEGAFGAKITGVPGGTVPVRYGEAKGIFSFEKRMSPRPPKEKRGGISISPRTPLKRHKGAGCGPPLWKPFLGEGGGPRLWKPLLGMGSGSGKRSRGCPICTPLCSMPADAAAH